MTWQIKIQGQVQGVGFRPMVWREALRRNLKGSVANGLQGLVIRINANEAQALDFQQYILENKPETARITGHSIQPISAQLFDNFTIETSGSEGLPLLLLTPDVALCEACRTDIRDAQNRRFRYAFTTCTVCGPRYSILAGVPYDRPQTTMQAFKMCAQCHAEYDDPDNRRYFAQTNSCADCGIQMRVFDSAAKAFIAQKSASDLELILKAWQTGAIVAIKGIGGYLLTCDATNVRAIESLRQRKNRPSKPFALMYPDLQGLREDAKVSEQVELQLKSSAAPIVLLEVLEKPKSGLNLAGIAPGLHKIGAMLPNAPLFELLLQDFGKPIVATSGNLSNAPLIFDDETAIQELSSIADYILIHNRHIIMPQDDSVMALSHSGRPNMIRRARGLAPSFIQTGLPVPQATVLALGAEMKGSFTLAHLGNLNLNQYLGDLQDFDTQQRFESAMKHFLELFQAQPSLLLGDLHPGYFTAQLGRSLSEKWNIPFVQIQHHKAHFAAVLAENSLLETEKPVLGVIWDGTGLGEDGQIWGGEFLVYTPHSMAKFSRGGHFDYFPLILGDKMPREPRLSALSACHSIPEASELLRAKFTETEWNLYSKMALQPNGLKTSSVGRLFDAVASLLGLADKVSYEGEAALRLEDLGRQGYRRPEFSFQAAYALGIHADGAVFRVDHGAMVRAIIQDIHEGVAAEIIAAKFHFSLVLLIESVANHLKINRIAFSGGVFQNTLLVDMIEAYLGQHHSLFFHQQLSANDENISFGQWAFAQAEGQF